MLAVLRYDFCALINAPIVVRAVGAFSFARLGASVRAFGILLEERVCRNSKSLCKPPNLTCNEAPLASKYRSNYLRDDAMIADFGHLRLREAVEPQEVA